MGTSSLTWKKYIFAQAKLINHEIQWLHVFGDALTLKTETTFYAHNLAKPGVFFEDEVLLYDVNDRKLS